MKNLSDTKKSDYHVLKQSTNQCMNNQNCEKQTLPHTNPPGGKFKNKIKQKKYVYKYTQILLNKLTHT